MRGALLISTLLTFAIIAYLFAMHTSAVSQANKEVRPEVEQIAGQDDMGQRIEDTYSLQIDTRSDGKVKQVKVTRVDPASPIATKYGLQADDIIVAAVQNGMMWDMAGSDDSEWCKLHIRDAYASMGQIIVQRGDQRIQLPDGIPVDRNGSPIPGAVPQQQQVQQMQPPSQAVPAQPANNPAPAAPNKGQGQDQTMDQIRNQLHSLPGAGM